MRCPPPTATVLQPCSTELFLLIPLTRYLHSSAPAGASARNPFLLIAACNQLLLLRPCPDIASSVKPSPPLRWQGLREVGYWSGRLTWARSHSPLSADSLTAVALAQGPPTPPSSRGHWLRFPQMQNAAVVGSVTERHWPLPPARHSHMHYFYAVLFYLFCSDSFFSIALLVSLSFFFHNVTLDSLNWFVDPNGSQPIV